MTESYNHIDLFSGIGGFTLGLHLSGLPIDKIYFSEIDKYAISVYRRQFPDAEYLGSVDTISGGGFPSGKYVLTFGFPCQDLSVAGKRKGFDGSRSSLFFEAMRIISEVRPDIFIFENVKGFYSSNHGKDFIIALQTIADLGLYVGQWQLLNTAWFLPQNRERIYFVGSLRTGHRPEVFPIRESNAKIKCGIKETQSSIIDPNYLERDCRIYNEQSPCLNARNYKEPPIVKIGDFRIDEGLRVRKDNICPSLCARAREDGSGQPIILSRPHGYNSGGEKDLPCLRSSSYEHNEFIAMQWRRSEKGRLARKQNQKTGRDYTPFSEGHRELVPSEDKNVGALTSQAIAKDSLIMEKANTVTPDAYLTSGARKRDKNGKAVLTSMCERRIRRLTPIECERLQGFPDNWTKYGHDGIEISDTQRYKMCGNAVSVPVVKEIGKRLTNIKGKAY